MAIAGLGQRKGRIAPGFDADLVLWEPDAERVVQATELHFKHKLSPYIGRTLLGEVHETWLRGQLVYDQTGHRAPSGRMLLGRDVVP